MNAVQHVTETILAEAIELANDGDALLMGNKFYRKGDNKSVHDMLVEEIWRVKMLQDAIKQLSRGIPLQDSDRVLKSIGKSIQENFNSARSSPHLQLTILTQELERIIKLRLKPLVDALQGLKLLRMN